MGLFHIAAMYYWAVLRESEEAGPIPGSLKRVWQMYSPEKAAAYNLCILLSVSGSKAVAFRVRRKYLCFE